MREDMREQDALTHQGNTERDELSTELAATHQALNDLASAWVTTTPSAERLVTFTRQLPSQQADATRPTDALLSQREPVRQVRAESTADSAADARRRSPRHGRTLAGLAAAIVIVGLLAATLLRLAPGRTGRVTRIAPTASATTSLPTARLAEEPSQQAPGGAWSTVAHAQLIPAPSNANVVYQITSGGSGVRVSDDGGATWRTVAIPTFPKQSILSDTLFLRVSDADPQVILLSMTLFVNNYGASACPAGSHPPSSGNQLGMHGGILASGQPYCIANFASHDGGASWASMQVPNGVNYPPSALDATTFWQLGDTLYGLDSVVVGPTFYGSSLLISHDFGATWAYSVSSSPETDELLCSFLPSASDGALYAITTSANTSTRSCIDGELSPIDYTVWRSADGGATWQRVSTLTSNYLLLVAATPTTSGHGVWLYAQRFALRTPATMLVSADGGATWSASPALPSASEPGLVQPVTGALADGSVVLAELAGYPPTSASWQTNATYYAWRPGDAAWRPLAASLTANYGFHSDGSKTIILARGGQRALDSLWVISANAGNGSPNDTAYTTYRYAIS